tara:strand:- start:1530 stop:2255 length:726 start_codon:yes stop_codon:yes gene_type:complete
MEKKPPPQVLFNFQEDDYAEGGKVEEAEPSLSVEVKDDSEGVEDFESYEDELIKIEQKEKPNETEIFENIPSPPPSPHPSPVPQYIEEEVKPKPVKAKKPRKPMSEEHKKKLALAREKAMAVRKQKAEEKKKMKALEKEEKELLKKQKVKKVQKLKEEVEDDLDEPVYKIDKKLMNLTKQDLQDAQLEAIMKYDAMRKERKKKKQEEKMIEEGKKKMLNNIQRATGTYSYRDGSNRFDNCY